MDRSDLLYLLQIESEELRMKYFEDYKRSLSEACTHHHSLSKKKKKDKKKKGRKSDVSSNVFSMS